MKNSGAKAGPPDKTVKREILFHGIPASPGIAIGTVMLIADSHRDLVRDVKTARITPEQVEPEITLFRQAVDRTREEIKELRTRVQSSLESHEANIFDAHFLIVDDKMLMNEVCSSVTKKLIPADAAFSQTMQKYIAAISDEIVKIVKATNGHAAILFTSYKVLEAVYRQTKDRLTQYELIRMTRSNKSAIADFKKSKNGVLFASGSMWEGVDCIGDCLSSVIIPRLPFPMRSATMESKKEECNGLGEFVNTICVPEMLIKLRQGLGRLIRCETDTGLISILDTRATTGKYADKVGNVLAKYTKAETLDEVEAFFREVKSPAYFEV